MEAVLKVGGSLAEEFQALRGLLKALGALAGKHRILVVPGGGRFADLVREAQKSLGLSKEASHGMAILTMDLYGLLLGDLAPKAQVTRSLKGARGIARLGKLPILLPSKLLLRPNPLEASWDVTSDSVAAYVARLLKARKLILVTDVDGVYDEDPKVNPRARLLKSVSAEELLGLRKRTSVDTFLPRLLIGSVLECYVVNGRHPERVEAILNGREALYTRITSTA